MILKFKGAETIIGVRKRFVECQSTRLILCKQPIRIGYPYKKRPILPIRAEYGSGLGECLQRYVSEGSARYRETLSRKNGSSSGISRSVSKLSFLIVELN